MDITTIIGVAGATLVLIAFLLNEVNKWKNDDFIYDLVNFLGSLLLFLYAVMLNSVPFMILNAVWGLFSLKDVVGALMKNGKKLR